MDSIFDNIPHYINELKSDSLWEDVVVKFIFKDQKNFDTFIANIRERVDMDNLMNNQQLLSVIIISLILIGGAYYLERDRSSTPEQKTTIEVSNNKIIQIGAGMVDLSAQDFKAIIDSAIKDKDSLAKNAAKVVAPAKLDPNASITFNDNDELRISNDVVRVMPRFVQEPIEEEYVEDFKNIELEIRATDLDSNKRGWAVVISELHKKRVRLQLDPGLDPEILLGKRKITADVTVIFGYDNERNRIPKLVFLRGINK